MNTNLIKKSFMAGILVLAAAGIRFADLIYDTINALPGHHAADSGAGGRLATGSAADL